jgi:hypothetical protein
MRAFENVLVPPDQPLSEDNILGLHVTPPLRKLFVVASWVLSLSCAVQLKTVTEKISSSQLNVVKSGISPEVIQASPTHKL